MHIWSDRHNIESLTECEWQLEHVSHGSASTALLSPSKLSQIIQRAGAKKMDFVLAPSQRFHIESV